MRGDVLLGKEWSRSEIRGRDFAEIRLNFGRVFNFSETRNVAQTSILLNRRGNSWLFLDEERVALR
jgi:hypothetical protein